MNLSLLQQFEQLKYRLTGTFRVKTPMMLQMEALECGAAALGIVLAYHGKRVPLEKLRIDCGVSRNGSNAANMARAARNYGLEVVAYKKEPDQLKKLDFPMIVFWNFNHFVVVEGYSKNVYYLNDPASGHRVVDSSTFDQSFTGVVMTFKPGPDFSAGGVKASLWPLIFSWLKDYKKLLSLLFFAGLLLVLPGLALPALTKVFVDQVLVSRMAYWMVPVITGMAITAVIRLVLLWVQKKYLLVFETGLSLKNTTRLLWRILNMPVSFHAQRSAGDLASRVGLNDQVAAMISGPLGNTLLNLIMLVFFALLMFLYSTKLAFAAIAISLFNILVLKKIYEKRVNSNQQLLLDAGKLSGLSASGLLMIETLKAGASENDFFQRWGSYQAKLLNNLQKTAILNQVLQAVPVLLNLLSTTVILGLGASAIMEGNLSIGSFVAFQSLMASFNQPITSLVNLGGMLQELQASINRLDDVYRYPVEENSNHFNELPEQQKTIKLTGEVELQEVTFGYGKLEPPIIKNFSLKLKPGSRVAVVGKTGCGKSTLANLVGGLYRPWSGKILFDGKERDQIPDETMNHSLSMVDQNLFLFEGSIRENIAFWDQTLSEKEIIEAAKIACIHDEIVTRPGSFGSRVSENGKNLSKGQQQRLEIARALAIKPSILILDEATSSLDARSEFTIDLNIRKTGCTCLIIAHRLSTIRDCDEIIVMDQGLIVQRGTHEQLIEEEGLYRKLVGE